jgi:signal peptide peptidase SppA
MNGEALRAAALAWASSQIWAMDDAAAVAILSALARPWDGGDTQSREAAEAQAREIIEAAGGLHPATEKALARKPGAVAFVPVVGTIMQRPGIFERLFGGATSPGVIADAVEEAVASSDVKAVVMVVDSLGGVTNGVTEAAGRIRAARGKGTPILSHVVGNCMSAAYWLAAAGDEIDAVPSAMVGGIGAFQTHDNRAGMYEQEGVERTFQQAGAFKTENADTQALSPEAVAHRLANVGAVFDQFAADVAAGRGIAAGDVRGERFGQGRAYLAPLAMGRGLVDKVRRLDETLTALGFAPAGLEDTGAGARRRSYQAAANQARLRGVRPA